MTDSIRIKPIENATGRTWQEWLTFMDENGAKDLDHHTIATKVSEQLTGEVQNPGWWAQLVTVAYEQFTGRRVPGQQSDGTFQASVSKATKLGMKELMAAWTDFAVQDREVIDGISSAPKVGGTDKRLTWRAKLHDGSVIMMSEPKNGGSSSAVVQVMGLRTHEMNVVAKATWSSILERFVVNL